MRYPQAAQVTEESRLLYLLIKMLQHHPTCSKFHLSPSKLTSSIKGQYKRIADRVRDDPVVGSLAIPLPNINVKSISNFFRREEKMANFRATVRPRVKTHRNVLSGQPMPDAPALPSSLPPPDRPQVQYQEPHHVAGKRRGEKRRLDFEDPQPDCQPGPSNRCIQPKPATASYVPSAVAKAPVLLLDFEDPQPDCQPGPSNRCIQPKPATASYVPSAVAKAPVLLVLPTQPQAPSVRLLPSANPVFLPVLPQ
ncbi:uncharacterized protein LOC121685018 isoform X1 [Alosa sapidissima]|uniref:uncharacterized protein LOC121685018 isoform X1 n=1 Tax=Alosa sapidissima TaxID=34773 RepID=UPI001C099B96|nr:uncharacterized protein LOC121685018 isoform X1 [Alosa sapidissima]XP_041921191.1 uncharacterized protein LOC121685018 isoform X1 [Alosa sapidissima]